ncbi:MAG: PAS domain-containing protein [Cyanobacteria bacterium P01_D01_bin.1]
MTSPVASDWQKSVNSTSPSFDLQAVCQALWDDDYVGRAVLEVIEQGTNFRFLKLNATIIQADFFSTSDILGRSLPEVILDQSASRYQEYCSSCVQTKKLVRFEISQRSESALERWWLVTIAPVKDAADCVHQLVLSAIEISENKKTEADLKIAVEDSRTIIDHVQESITIHDPNGKILKVNKSLLDLYQVNYEEALSYRISHEYAAPNTPVHLLPELWSRALAGEKLEFEWPAKRPHDGGLLHLEVSLQRIFLSGQAQLIACLRDISDRKQAEEQKTRLLGILEATPDLVGIADAEGNCFYLNQAGRKMMELPEEVPINLPVGEAMPEDQKEMFENIVLPYAIQHGSWSGDLRLKTASAKEIPVSQVVIAHKELSGALRYISTIARDISQIKAVEEKLRDREQFLDSIYSGTDIAIFSWDIDKNDPNKPRCSGWNPACERAIGISADRALGKTPTEVFGPEQGKSITQNNLQCADQKRVVSYEEEILIENQPTWWATKLHPISDEVGRVYRVVGTTTNITELKLNTLKLESYSRNQARQTKELTAALRELKRTQAQIVQSEKMSSLGQMVAGVAHEINNPVNFIHANIEPACNYATDLLEIIALYQHEYSQPSTALLEMLEEVDFDFIQKDFTELLKSMKVGTSRIREIVLSLRNFSRLDEAEIKPVDLHEGIDSTLIILAHKIKTNSRDKGIEIEKSYQLSSLVECYSSQMNQVVMNILANAIDALDQSHNPKINISTMQQTDNAVITISDNGAGMPKVVQDQIFNPFFTTKQVGKGTGMGLSISYQIVTEKHKGTLAVDSEPGLGTQFVISIPLKQPDK